MGNDSNDSQSEQEVKILDQIEEIFKESKVHSTLKNISKKLNDFQRIKDIDKEMIEELLLKKIEPYVKKSEELKRMALTPENIFKKCKHMKTKYHFFKFPFKKEIIKFAKDLDEKEFTDDNKKYKEQLKKDLKKIKTSLDNIEKVFKPLPDLLDNLSKIKEEEKAKILSKDTFDEESKKYYEKQSEEKNITNIVKTLFSRKEDDEWYYNYKNFLESSFDPNDDSSTYYQLKPEWQDKLVEQAKAVNKLYKAVPRATDINTFFKRIDNFKVELKKFIDNFSKAHEPLSTDQINENPKLFKKEKSNAFITNLDNYYDNLCDLDDYDDVGSDF